MKCPKCQYDNPDNTKFCGNCGAYLTSSETDGYSRTETLQSTFQELSAGDSFAGRYQIVEEVGSGGMGRVFKAIDKEIDEKIALKVLKPEISTDEKTISRFRNELRMARKISHKNVCRMYHIGRDKETRFITMEYVSGEDLKTTIRRVGPLSTGKAVKIAKQICKGLSEAHQIGILHRDLKPQNIMIDQEGDAKIMDFGIARSLVAEGITETGVMIGTPDYMSPEQVEGKDVDKRTDIYSLGIIIYEMVTGDVPFKGNTPFSVALKHKNEVPQAPRELNIQIPDELNRIILKCLEKDREKRYQDPRELLVDLENIEKRIPSTKEIIPPRKKRSKVKKEKTEPSKKFRYVLVIGIVLLGALIIAGYFYFNHNKSGEEGLVQKEQPAKIATKEGKQAGDKEEPKETEEKPVVEVPEKSKEEVTEKTESEEKPSSVVSKEPKKSSEKPPEESKAVTPTYGSVEISSNPRGAELFIDNKRIGKTPVKSNVDPGKHKIRIRGAPGFNEKTDTIEIEAGKTFSKHYTLKEAKYSVSINTNPSNASVFIDGKSAGKSPVQMQLSIGQYRIRINKDGYKSTSESINLESNVQKTYSLKKLENVKVNVIVQPYAEVFIDGKSVGEIPPIKIIEITEGKHTIQFVSERLGKDISKEIEIKPGAARELRMNMITEEIKIK
ncbi:MAG: protein kinase domain-containing protein [Candidatus Aminicenantaceae bacterium]